MDETRGVRLDQAVADIAHNRDQLMWRAGGLVMGLSVLVNITAFVPPLFVVVSTLAVPAMLIAHALGLRLALLTPARHASSAYAYGFVRRWHGRLVRATLGTFGYATLTTPLVSLIAVPLTYGAITWGFAQYLCWTLERERRGLGPHLLEWLTTAALALLLVAMLVAVVVLGFVAAWLAQWAQQTWPGVFGAG